MRAGVCAYVRGNACGRVRGVARRRACGVAGARERGHVREWVRAKVGAEVGARVSARCVFVPFVSVFVALLCLECSTWNISRLGVVFTCTRCERVSCIGSIDTFNENVL